MSSSSWSTMPPAARPGHGQSPQNVNNETNRSFRPPFSTQQQQVRPPTTLSHQQQPLPNSNMQARPMYSGPPTALQQQQPLFARQPTSLPLQQPAASPYNHSSRPPVAASPITASHAPYGSAPIPSVQSSIPQSNAHSTNNNLITPIEQSMSSLHLDKPNHPHHQPGKSRRVYADLNNTAATPPSSTHTAPSTNANNSSAPILTTGGRTPLGMPNRPLTKPRIDPNAIPSPVQLQAKKNEDAFRAKLNSQIAHQHPQSGPTNHYELSAHHYASSTDYAPQQQQQLLNCHPQIMQATLPCIPDSENLIRDTELPFGIVLQPFYSNTDAEIPVLKQEELVRCTRCKGYVNGFCQFSSSGFRCNLCGFDNKDVISTVAGSMSSSSFPAFELMSNGTVEFEAPEEYWMTSNDKKGAFVQPAPLYWFVAIDVSRFAIQSGVVRTICNVLKEWVHNEQQSTTAAENRIKLGIMTFDTTLHFYDLTRQQPCMMVVSELNDVYVPMSTENLFVDPVEYSAAIDTLLEQLPGWYENTMIPHAAFGAAVQGSHVALKSTGGKVSIIQTSLPSIGPSESILKNRDDPSLYGTDKEKGLFQPQNKSNFYMQLGTACAQSGISIDLWCFPPLPSGKNSYMDIATIGVLSALTGGDVHYYPNLGNSSNDPYAPPSGAQPSEVSNSNQTPRITHDLLHSIQRKQGYSAILRLRCSNGLSVGEHYGNFYMSNATDIELANINENTCIGIALRHDSKLPSNQPVYFQCAMLYTTVDGHRRVRVHNFSSTVGSTANAIFKTADLDASMNFCIKRMISHATAKKSSKDIGSALDELTVHILTAYRKYCAPDASPAQLILPESFKNMPILCSSLKKSVLLRKDTNINVDTRVFFMRKLKALTISETSRWLYPQCIQLHTWFEQLLQLQQQHEAASSTTATIDFSTFLLTPPLERLSYDRFDTKGIYWVHSHEDIFLWIGQEAPASVVDHLKVSSTTADLVESIVVAPADNSSKHIFLTLLQKLYQQSISTSAYLPRFHIIRQGVDLEVDLAHVLVEDAIYNEPSYVDYLCLIHKQIQLELEREKQESVISAASYWAHRY